MSLNGALQVGRTALAASQAALQVAGNNMANAATEGFHRRSVHFSPLKGEVIGPGAYVGQGVRLLSVRREVDTALQARLRDSISEENAAVIDQRFLTALETLQNELTDNDLSSLFSAFFSSFSELANSPSDNAVRAVVIQQGQNVSSRIADLQRDYSVVLKEVDSSLASTVKIVNNVLDQLVLINGQISTSELGQGQANSLRDQRDQLIDTLSKHLEVTVIEQPSGSVDVLVNSTPILLAGQSRGLEMRTQSVAGTLEVSVRVAADGTELRIDSGTIGGLMRQREETVQPVVEALDKLAGQLIFQVNRLHSQGQGTRGFTDVTGTYLLNDTTVNLNADGANLPFRIENGSFFIHQTHVETGQRTTYQINVDGDAMSLQDLVDEINLVVGVPNVTAGISPERALTLQADPGYTISFSEDSSGALASLGVNTFFTGQGASTIAVNEVLLDDPTMLAAGADHVPGSNDTALAIANFQDLALDELGAISIRDFWHNEVAGLAVKGNAANAAVESSSLVRQNLFAQSQSVSGVSLDEEAINLLTYQRQFQAAARFITVIDEALQLLISIV